MTKDNYERERLLFGDNVRRYRLRREITQKELARRACFSRAYISRLEAGQANPSIVTIIELARVLQIDVCYLMINTRRMG